MANRGMPAVLIRPTAMPTLPETNEEITAESSDDVGDDEGQGRGESNGSARRTTRRRSRASVSAANEKGKGRKLTLPDSVFDRLVLTAIKKGTTASAVAAEVLDRNLPRLKIAADD